MGWYLCLAVFGFLRKIEVVWGVCTKEGRGNNFSLSRHNREGIHCGSGSFVRIVTSSSADVG